MDEQLRHERLGESALAKDGRFWEIYGKSFPAAEKEPREIIEKSVRLKTGMAFRSVFSGTTVAMATAHILRKVPALFLVYLAVDAGHKGRGTGGGLLEFIYENGALAIPGSLGMVWETERPEDAASEAERTVRERRLGFFRRHGAAIIARNYRQPALEGVSPMPMNILFRPAKPELNAGPELTQALIRSIYFEKYGELNGFSRRYLETLLA